jgi:hypothetical protein
MLPRVPQGSRPPKACDAHRRLRLCGRQSATGACCCELTATAARGFDKPILQEFISRGARAGAGADRAGPAAARGATAMRRRLRAAALGLGDDGGGGLRGEQRHALYGTTGSSTWTIPCQRERAAVDRGAMSAPPRRRRRSVMMLMRLLGDSPARSSTSRSRATATA